MTEIVISISILLIIFSIGSLSFQTITTRKKIDSAVNNLVSIIEMAKINAITGKGEQNYGIKFYNDSFVYFTGSSYVESDANNQTNIIHSGLEIITNITETTESIVFSRLSGTINHSDVIVITVREKNNIENGMNVVIGTLGEVSVIK